MYAFNVGEIISDVRCYLFLFEAPPRSHRSHCNWIGDDRAAEIDIEGRSAQRKTCVQNNLADNLRLVPTSTTANITQSIHKHKSIWRGRRWAVNGQGGLLHEDLLKWNLYLSLVFLHLCGLSVFFRTYMSLSEWLNEWAPAKPDGVMWLYVCNTCYWIMCIHCCWK